MYHVLIYNNSAFNVSNSDATPISDNWIGIQNGHYFPQQDLQLFGAWIGGAALTRVTLVTPQSRRVVPPVMYPIDQAVLPPDRPHIWDRRTNPFTLRAVEEISLQMNIGGTVGGANTAVLFAGDGLVQAPRGDIFSLHGVSTTPAVIGQWTVINVLWDQTIPSGTYTVIGSQVQSPNAIAHRWNFRSPVMRPGFLSITSLGKITDPSYYWGGWGALGTFTTTAYPFIEVYCNAADAAHDVVMNFVKTG